MFSILMTSLTDKPLILQWEVWLRSLLGLEGLNKLRTTGSNIANQACTHDHRIDFDNGIIIHRNYSR